MVKNQINIILNKQLNIKLIRFIDIITIKLNKYIYKE
jgi:hypothetical protein